jgi:hypothetical protein
MPKCKPKHKPKRKARLMTIKSLCATYNISAPTIQRWRRKGLITPVRFDKLKALYDVASFEAVWRKSRAGRKDKGYLVVLRALQGGARTSVEIASLTDMPVANASAHLNALRHTGLARIVSRSSIKFHDGQGAPCHEWRIA